MRQGIISRRATAIVVICCITTLLSFAVRHFELDDSLIYARYVRNALNGQGLVYNAGEHINSLTSPLLAILLLVTSWMMHGHILLAELILSATFLAGACILAEEIAPWSGVLIASTGYFYMCFGMETTLFLFLIMLTYTLYRKDRLDLVPSAALLTFLTRFEGGLLGSSHCIRPMAQSACSSATCLSAACRTHRCLSRIQLPLLREPAAGIGCR